MDVEAQLEVVRRLDRAESMVKELNQMLIAFCLKSMDGKGVARLDKPLLDKALTHNVQVDRLKSGSIKFKVGKNTDGS